MYKVIVKELNSLGGRVVYVATYADRQDATQALDDFDLETHTCAIDQLEVA